MKWGARLAARAERYCDRWWYLPLLALMAGADLFLIVIPTEGLLVSSVMLRPRKWIRYFLWASIGSGLGAFLLALLTQIYGEPLVTWLAGDTFNTPAWHKTEGFFDKYGILAMIFVAVGPLPSQPAVIIGALAHMSAIGLALAVLVGRAVKYALFAWSATHAPKLFEKWSSPVEEAREIQQAAMEELGTASPVPETTPENPDRQLKK